VPGLLADVKCARNKCRCRFGAQALPERIGAGARAGDADSEEGTSLPAEKCLFRGSSESTTDSDTPTAQFVSSVSDVADGGVCGFDSPNRGRIRAENGTSRTSSGANASMFGASWTLVILGGGSTQAARRIRDRGGPGRTGYT
jgi:hypothetical protein